MGLNPLLTFQLSLEIMHSFGLEDHFASKMFAKGLKGGKNEDEKGFNVSLVYCFAVIGRTAPVKNSLFYLFNAERASLSGSFYEFRAGKVLLVRYQGSVSTKRGQ